jgi:hypothetical protein
MTTTISTATIMATDYFYPIGFGPSYVGRILLHHNPFDFNAFLINLGKRCAQWDSRGRFARP